MTKVTKLFLLSAAMFGALALSTLSTSSPLSSKCYGGECKPDGAKALGSHECCSRRTRYVDGTGWVCCTEGKGCK